METVDKIFVCHLQREIEIGIEYLFTLRQL